MHNIVMIKYNIDSFVIASGGETADQRFTSAELLN